MGTPWSKRDDERRTPMLSNAHGSIAMGVIMQARLTNHERLMTAYDILITSAAVLGGFAINAALETIKESDFGNQAAFDSYAVLLVTSALLDLYAMVALVVNKFVASRAEALSTSELQELETLGLAGDVTAVNSELARLNERTARRRAEFVHRSRCYRTSAVVAFVVSLPCFLGALAAKQFSVQPKRRGAVLRLGSELRFVRASAEEVALLPSPPSPPQSMPPDVLLPPRDEVEPFTPIRWSLAVFVGLGTCAVLVAVLGQLHLLRMVRRTV